MKAVSRGSARAGGAPVLDAGQAGRLPPPSIPGTRAEQSFSDEDTGLLTDPSTASEGHSGDPQRQSAGASAQQRGAYDIITGRYAEPQPGDFSYEAPPVEPHSAQPSGKVSVRKSNGRQQRSSGRPNGARGKSYTCERHANCSSVHARASIGRGVHEAGCSVSTSASLSWQKAASAREAALLHFAMPPN